MVWNSSKKQVIFRKRNGTYPGQNLYQSKTDIDPSTSKGELVKTMKTHRKLVDEDVGSIAITRSWNSFFFDYDQ